MLMGCGIVGCTQITNLQAVNGGAKYTSTMTDGSGATIDGIVSSQVCNRPHGVTWPLFVAPLMCPWYTPPLSNDAAVQCRE